MSRRVPVTSAAWLACCALGVACGAQPSRVAVAVPNSLECTYSWGGETKTVRVAPTEDVYGVPEIAVGDQFALKFVYVTAPADVAGFRAYAYSLTDDGAVPLHEAKYRAPYATSGSYGFTGLQLAYDRRGDELAYFCAWVAR